MELFCSGEGLSGSIVFQERLVWGRFRGEQELGYFGYNSLCWAIHEFLRLPVGV